jgi:hypothetical protein
MKVVKAIKQCDKIHISSCLTERMFLLWVVIRLFHKNTAIFDEGTATMNPDYAITMSQHTNPLIFLLLKLMTQSKNGRTLYTIFNPSRVPNEFLRACCISQIKKINIKPPCYKTDEQTSEKQFAIVLGSPKCLASTMFRLLQKELPSELCNYQILLKDHPLIKGCDDLQCPPEVFLLRNPRSVGLIVADSSSSLWLCKLLAPDARIISILSGSSSHPLVEGALLEERIECWRLNTTVKAQRL